MMITLLTDFGLEDAYIGIMKGVMLHICPNVTFVDLTHQIAPQHVMAARYQLMNAVPYFPIGTIHLAVVDPGVGTHRRGIAIEFERGYLVGPDNGIFSGVLKQFEPQTVVELNQRDYWRTPEPSRTFHGRDIFAPIAAHLATGVSLQACGTPIAPNTLLQPSLPHYQCIDHQIIGCVQHIDRFGNLITNIPAALIPSEDCAKTWWVELNDRTIPWALTYGAVPRGELLALIGSHGWVEIAANGESAQALLQMGDLQMGDLQMGDLQMGDKLGEAMKVKLIVDGYPTQTYLS